MTIWRLKKSSLKIERKGHPWKYTNELNNISPGHSPGDLVKLEDREGGFVAFGYGNPLSTIAFRALSTDPDDNEFFTPETISRKLKTAWGKRIREGFTGSFRLCFSEADFLPGLVIDFYKTADAQIFSCQILTAGMEKLFSEALHILEQSFPENWNRTAVVLRNDANIRRLEGLEIKESIVLKNVPGLELTNVTILLNSYNKTLIEITTDLLGGQKTGFFLDQSYNINCLLDLVSRQNRPLKVLDLCCYVGQWSTHLANLAKMQNIKMDFTLIDSSQKALDTAKINLDKYSVEARFLKMDVMEGLKNLNEQFDIVISDPPAFIKSRKHIVTGTHAYQKLNTHAFRLTNPQGLVISCSCSGNLSDEDFQEILGKALDRSKRKGTVLLRGGHAPDHPILENFPEGRYLKMFTFRLT